MSIFTVRQVETARVGRTHVTGTTGLYLHVNADGSRRWVWRFTRDGRPSEMGLGKYPIVTLADARDRALDLARQLKQGADPVRAKRDARQQKARDATTFENVVQQYASAFVKDGQKIVDRVTLLERHASALMPLPIGNVNTKIIEKALAPVNANTPRTARRTLSAVGKILRYAKVHGLRETGDDADWRGVFELIWAAPPKGSHHRAMPYKDVPALFACLTEHVSATSLALRMLILCASRTGEVLGMRWDEVDLPRRTWTIPATRMKMRQAHAVPLSDAALDVLAAARDAFGDWGHVFKGMSKSKLSDRALETFLHRTLKIDDASVHGFRSSFRDWCGDCTEFPREVAEAALAHVVVGVEGAYRRGSALEKRRALMAAWGAFVTGAQVSTVLSFVAPARP
jgi:integrase